MKNKTVLFSILLSFQIMPVFSAEIDMNMAQMQAMDKITGRVSIIEVPVNGAVNFGSFSVLVRSCKTRTEDEIPENFAFVDVTDKSFNEEEYNIFKGWMFSSSPAVNAVEHPIYDVWLLKCFNATPKRELMLSADELRMRDNLPRLNEYIEQTNKIGQNSFDVGEPQNILFKDAMYKEMPQEQESNTLPNKIDGEPQNLLNIQDSYESDIEQLVNMGSDELSEALTNEAQKLEKQNIEVLEDQAQSTLEELNTLHQEIDAELKKHQ